MGKPIPLAYLITFTCYGTRLHGAESGSVDRDHNKYGSDFLPPNPGRVLQEKKQMKHAPYLLDEAPRKTVLEALRQHCTHRGWKLEAAHVRSTHIHFVAAAEETPETILNQVKAYATRALNLSGLENRSGTRWTERGSKRYLWKREQVEAAIHYVLHEQGKPMAVWENPERLQHQSPDRKGGVALAAGSLQGKQPLPCGRGSDRGRGSEEMNMNIVNTTCPMDCPDTCSLEVAVEDGRIATIKGSLDHPTTAGFICGKVASFSKRVYHDDRLLYPMRRSGAKGSGEFTRISWETAIAEITSRFREISKRWGAEAILPYHYGGSNGFVSDGLLDEFYFAKLGASRIARTLCASTAGGVTSGMYGKMAGVAFEDFVHAKLIVIWGGNPKASNIHLVPFLKEAKRAGAFIAAVDPVNNFSPAEVDLHLPVFPGADLPVALAMIRLWNQQGKLDNAFLDRHADGLETLLARAEEWPVERAAAAARVPAAEIVRLAAAYASTSPALIRVGWGIERNSNGGQAIAAIIAMPALLGKFGVRGGGYTLSNGGVSRLDKNKIFGPFTWNTREINMTQLGAALGGDGAEAPSPPIKAVFIYNCNPAATVPDQEAVLRGLRREDLFTVVSEQVMTDTAQYADILLPATTFLEHRDVRRAYGAYVAGGSVPVIAARGEAMPNEMMFAALGRAMGCQDKPFTWDSATCMRKVAEALSLAGHPADPAILEAGKCQRYAFAGPGPIQFNTAFPLTPDGKIHLTPPALGPKPYRFDPVEDSRFPLALVSPSNSKMISSTLGEYNYPELRASLHPDDAAARGIAGGDVVRVFNDLGEVVCRAQVSRRLRQGVVLIPKGAWQKASLNGRTATALCPATVNMVGGGACFNDARVEVARS